MKKIRNLNFQCHLLTKFIIALVLLLNTSYAIAQSAGFIATIGVNTYTVKNGDVLHVCKDGMITYKNTAAGFDSIMWSFDTGKIFTTTLINPAPVLYPTEGSAFKTTQTVYFTNGSNAAITITVIVKKPNPAPVASFDYTPQTTECASGSITFDGKNSIGSGLSYLWNFGDNTTGTGNPASHSYLSAIASSGLSYFSASLTVTDNNGCYNASSSKTITVKNIPDASLSNDPANADLTIFNGVTTFCKSDNLPNYNFVFINNSSTYTSNTKYIFDWGDGTKNDTLINWQPGNTQPHTYNAGNNILTLTVEGTNGCQAQKQFNVFLGKNAGSSFGTVDNQTDYCEGDFKDFKFTPGLNNPPGTQYVLHVDDCSVDSVFTDLPGGEEYVVRHYFNTPICDNNCSFVPTYTATLSVVNPCKTIKYSTFDLNVYGRPKAKISSDTVGCINTKIPFTNTSNFGSVYENGACINSGIQVWTISPSAGASFNTSETGSLNGNDSDWTKWTNGSGVLNVTFTQSGTYTITLYISNKKCKIDSISRKICIQNKPSAMFKFSGVNALGCLSDTIKFENNTSPGVCILNKYKWTITNDDPNGCNTGKSPLYINGQDTSVSPEVWFQEPGNYTISLEAKASNSCLSDTSQKITIKGLAKVSINTISSICVGNSISPTANVTDCYSGSTLTYKWKFPGGSPDSSLSANPGNIKYDSIGAKTVSLFVTNACGTTNATKTFDVIANPIAKAGGDIVMCSGDNVSIGSNTETYTYDWSPKTGLSSYNIAQPKITHTNNGTTNDTLIYHLTVSGGINCKDSDIVTVVVKPSPIVTVDKPAYTLCKGDGVTVTAFGAQTYIWSPNLYISNPTSSTVTVNPPSSQTYIVQGSNSNGCSSNAPVSINVVDKPVANAGSDITLCSGGSGTLGVNTGSYNYQWSPGTGLNDSTDAQPAVHLYNSKTSNDTLTYYVTVTQNNCFNIDSVQVIVKPSPSLKISPANAEVCTGNSILITASGADVYSWNPTDYLDNPDSARVTATPAVTTAYTVTGALSNGCFADTSITVTVRPDAEAYFDTSRSNFCTPYNLNSVINVTTYPDRNNLYKWYIGDSLYATNTNGTVPNFPVNNAGDSLLLKLVTTSKYNCRADSISIKLTSNAAADAAFTFTPKSGCEPLNIYFQNATNNLSSAAYSWNFGNGITSNLIQPDTVTYTTGPPNRDTTYYITLSADNGCKVTMYRDSIKVLAKPAAYIGIDSVLLCSGQAITLKNASLGSNLSFTWVFGNGDTLNTLSKNPINYSYSTTIVDTFTIKLYAQNNCGIDSNSIDVRVAPNTIQAQLSVGVDDLYGCTPHQVMFKNNTLGASKYAWKFGDNTDTTIYINNPATITHTYNFPGTYTASLFLSNGGCTDTTVYQTINVYAAPVADFTTQAVRNNVYCFGDTIYTTNNSSNADQYQWVFGDGSPADGSTSPFHYYSTTGTYEIILYADKVNDYGIVCTDSASKIIKLGEEPVTNATSSDTIRCFKNSSQLLATGGVIYHWQPNTYLSNTNTANPVSYATEPITYTVDITGASGCVVTDTVKVFVNLQLANASELPIANAFTPNGDGHNDDFGLSKLAVLSDGFKLWIYDRRGQLLFYTTNPQRRWNGTFNGTPQPPGTYVFQAEYKTKCLNDETILQHSKGTVVLIR